MSTLRTARKTSKNYISAEDCIVIGNNTPITVCQLQTYLKSCPSDAVVFIQHCNEAYTLKRKKYIPMGDIEIDECEQSNKNIVLLG